MKDKLSEKGLNLELDKVQAAVDDNKSPTSTSSKDSPTRKEVRRLRPRKQRISPRLRTISDPSLNSKHEAEVKATKKKISPRRERSQSVAESKSARRMSRKRSQSFKLLFDQCSDNVENEACMVSPRSKTRDKPSPLSPRGKPS